MSGATFDPDAMICLPTAKLAIMGPEAAVNAIYANKIEAIEDPSERDAYVQARRDEYMVNLDLFRAASEFMLETVVAGDEIRGELVRRLAHYENKDRIGVRRRHSVIRG